MLVSAPVGTIVTVPGSSRSLTCAIRSMAWVAASPTPTSGSCGPSRPDSPWISSGISCGPTSGRCAPAANGTPVIPPTRASACAFLVTFSRVWLPATVVTASTSRFGAPQARSMAMASPWPGSQSRTLLRGWGLLAAEVLILSVWHAHPGGSGAKARILLTHFHTLRILRAQPQEAPLVRNDRPSCWSFRRDEYRRHHRPLAVLRPWRGPPRDYAGHCGGPVPRLRTDNRGDAAG